ncbi:MAG TPA: PEP/pyruvate-binding domain-containing protein [Dissulfurispiraceae bacterium]|nr:PEP/pyruvate-binding domain-containing protein [Dissulfurispiraceae bacterium]
MAPSERITDVRAPIPSRYSILQEVVKEYPGVLGSSTPLFEELSREHRNWSALLRETRSYALRNFSLHDHHPEGLAAMLAVIGIFIEAAAAPEHEDRKSAIDCLLFYIEKIVMDGRQKLTVYSPQVQECADSLGQLSDELFYLVISNPHQLKKTGRLILDRQQEACCPAAFNLLYFRYLSDTYNYWLQQKDPAAEMFGLGGPCYSGEIRTALYELLYPVSHANLSGLSMKLKGLIGSADGVKTATLQDMLGLPSFSEIVAYYEDISTGLPVTGDALGDFGLKTNFLVGILDANGLSEIHDTTIRELGRTLASSAATMERNRLKDIFAMPLEALRNVFVRYPDTTLYSVHLIGSAIYGIGESGLVEWFNRVLTSFGFQYPRLRGITDEWQLTANKAHLKNIRAWLDLIGTNPKWSKTLISALMINLSLAGVHINDTDIFQKDITKLLNSDIGPVYNLIRQLARVFPAYFNVINAEGELREVSTALDDAMRNADPLVHFLRKHSHVESSSVIVDFAAEVFRFWLTKDKGTLRSFLPEDVFEQVEESGRFVDELHDIFSAVFRDQPGVVDDLTGIGEPEFLAQIRDVNAGESEKRRAWLAVRFYQILVEKYRLSVRNLEEHLKHATGWGLPSAAEMLAVLQSGDARHKLEAVLAYLAKLKDIILSSEKFEAIEDIARKRHIAAGVPSMYGRYVEKKFDALSMSYRLENLAGVLFGELIESINLRYITRATLVETEKFMRLFFKALRLSGISSNRYETALELLSGSLDVKRFSFSQYIDIFRGFSDAVQDIVNTYCTGIHRGNLKVIIQQIGSENILPKYADAGRGHNDFEFVNKIAEQFLRESVSASFCLQQLDVFISRILKTLIEQAEGLDVGSLDLLMSYDQKKALADIHEPDRSVSDRIHLGGKGYNLVRLASLGISVPAGFIITTEVFRCREAIDRFRYAGEHLKERIGEALRGLERRTGRLFGSPDNPLLVSVRSGAAISMPGMMDSLLNVGINEEVVKGLITQKKKGWFAWDCYRRFLQSWGMSFGMERDVFDAIMESYKKKYRVGLKIEFSPDQMMEVARSYRRAVTEAKIDIPDDPVMQLHGAIERVFASWMSAKAQNYREILSLSENWGTAVIVQEMIYGNLDTGSGTGVLFTRNPRDAGDRVMLWGDFTMGAQGEDIVSGLVRTLPLSNEQKLIEERTGDSSLEDVFPLIYHHLLKIMKGLVYDKGWSAQEIEFTFEGGDPTNLYLLQARDMALARKEVFMAFLPSPELAASYLSSGIGVGGGALSGRVAFDLDDINSLRRGSPSASIVLLRSDTVPDDIRQIAAADGLLTARGGSTSHASIIAGRLGKTCVVGCSDLLVFEQDRRCRLKKKTIRTGDYISIDGKKGAVYSGMHPVKEVMPLA